LDHHRRGVSRVGGRGEAAVELERSQRPSLQRRPWLLELSPKIANLHKIDKSDRVAAVWLHQNEGAVRRWYATLSQKQRDRWTHSQTIKLQYKRMTGASQQDEGEGKPATKRPSAWDRAKAQIAERDAAIARLQQELEAAALGGLERKNSEIARLRKERDAARTRLSPAQHAEIARLTRLSAAQNAEIARLRKERDAARKRLSGLQPRLPALERASQATEDSRPIRSAGDDCGRRLPPRPGSRPCAG
jgi:hypothetical protein